MTTRVDIWSIGTYIRYLGRDIEIFMNHMLQRYLEYCAPSTDPLDS